MTLFGGNVGSLTAIDMHVHLEPEEDNRIDSAAKKYFGDSGAARDRRGMAEYYRSRKIGFVVFSVDEKLTGKPRVTNDEVVEFAAANADIAVPFASIDPKRGSEGVARRRRPHVAAGQFRLRVSIRKEAARALRRQNGWSPAERCADSNCIPRFSSSSPMSGSPTPCMRFLPKPVFPFCFTPDTVGLERVCRVAEECD